MEEIREFMYEHDKELINSIREHIVKSLNPVALKVFDEAIEELKEHDNE